MTDTTAEETSTPEASSAGGRFLKAFALLSESRIGMLGLAIVVFWVTMAVIVDLLPLQDPLAQTRGAVNMAMMSEDKTDAA